MNLPSKDDLRMLMNIEEDPCISLFFPTYRRGTDRQQNRMTLINQVREVKQHFLASELSARKTEASTQRIAALLQPIDNLLEENTSWQHPESSMTVFCSPNHFHVYHLPFRVTEQVVVATHFYLKPLLPLLNDGHFFVLALSQNERRLIEGTRYSMHLVEVPETVPENLAQALRYDQPENQVRYYSSSSRGYSSKGGRRAAIFYGQGVGIDDTKKNLLRYFQQIDRGLHELLHDQQAPLVLAGVEYLLPIYREANTYPHLIEQSITGNPEQLSIETLHEHAWSIVERVVLKEQQEAQARYRELAQTEQASSNVSEVVPAAFYGHVADLFVALDKQLWGTFDPTTYTIEVHEEPLPNDEELLDLAAMQTVRHGGSVYAVEHTHMPGEALVAAVFRY